MNHWRVVPDIPTMAKGLTSAYVQLGAVGLRRPIAEHFAATPFPSGLTYNSHPLACDAALATIGVMEEDQLVEAARRTGRIMTGLLADLAARHPSVGAVRSTGFFRREGLYTFVRWNYFTNPPLSIAKSELREGFAVIDPALEVTERAVQ